MAASCGNSYASVMKAYNYLLSRHYCALGICGGYDHIDVKYAKSRNISVGYTPDVLSEATAMDMAFALALDITRGISRDEIG